MAATRDRDRTPLLPGFAKDRNQRIDIYRPCDPVYLGSVQLRVNVVEDDGAGRALNLPASDWQGHRTGTELEELTS
jgi:hypothetical protein